MYYGGISGRGLGKIQERKTEKESTTGVNVVELDELYWYLEHKPGTETRENIYTIANSCAFIADRGLHSTSLVQSVPLPSFSHLWIDS